MTILNYGELIINGVTVAYETPVEIKDGTIKRVPNPQINGQIIYTTDISENRTQITVGVRVTPESNDFFDEIYNNEDNNTLSFRDVNYTRVTLEDKPPRKDQDIANYVLYANPSVT